MTHPHATFQEEAHDITLTQQEKAAMRAHLHAAMNVAQAEAVRSPYTSSFIFSLHRNVYLRGAFAFLLVAAVGGSTAAAAQGALPGDVLYPVKIHVNERVEVALATNPVAKAQVETKLATRRVVEAQALATQGRLTATTTAQIETEFDKHATVAQVLSEKVAESNPEKAEEISLNLADTLALHSQILEQAASTTRDQETRKNSGNLAMYVRVKAESGRKPVMALAARAKHGVDTKGKGEGEFETASMPVATTLRVAATTTATSTATTTPETGNLEIKVELEQR